MDVIVDIVVLFGICIGLLMIRIGYKMINDDEESYIDDELKICSKCDSILGQGSCEECLK
jgi:hypothetical protein